MGSKSSEITTTSGYELIDSGEGARLERFGDRILIRPSSIAIWKRRRPDDWRRADAEYDVNGEWRIRSAPFEEWMVEDSGVRMKLRLQRNGQVGLFPEHLSYQSDIAQAVQVISSKLARKPKVLNLFAYTGLASLVAAKAGAEVVHIDNLKSVLSWAKENLELNNLAGVRLIPEDALNFVKREIKRGNSYDLIIADPPSFSRESKTKSWAIDQILPEFATSLVSLLERDEGWLYLSSHEYALGEAGLSNILLDVASSQSKIDSKPLYVGESDSPRTLPSGVLAIYHHSISFTGQ